MKRSIFIIVLVVALVLAITIPTLAGPPKNIVTGSGYWTNTAGPHHMYAEFNAQEAYQGQPAKGHLYLTDLDTGDELEVAVTNVGVNADGGGAATAWFCGTVVRAEGPNWAQYLYSTWWVVVQDGGSGVEETGQDYFRSGKAAALPPWVSSPNFASNTPWYGGNVQIH